MLIDQRNQTFITSVFGVILAVTSILMFTTQSTGQHVEKLLPGPAFSGVTPGPDGRLYGVTYEGGSSNSGTLYSIDPTLESVTTHVNFAGASNGSLPYDELIWDQATGKFYGTATSGGALGRGTVFSYTPGASTVTVLRSDFGIANTGFPRDQPHGLVIANGYIFGLALGFLDDVIFRMAMDGSGITVLEHLGGSRPQFLIRGQDGRLYGQTLYGGVSCPDRPSSGCGTIYRLRAVLPGDSDLQFQVLKEFQYYNGNPCPPGDANCVSSGSVRYNFPLRLIYGSDGLLYGSTFYSLFRLNPNASNPSASIQFIWTEGGGINLNAIEGSDGRLYAADYAGPGLFGVGQVISMNRDGSDVSILRTFSLSGGLTAYGPYGRLYRSPSGTIYGTSEYTVNNPDRGSIYSISSVPNTKVKVAGGNILVGSPGEGILLRSPSGTVCRKIAIDNTGSMTNTAVQCP
ncbi:MAG TPA: hypothetical protein PKD26_15365 [Pyrinomonadaceae bacterium]|nr:hypothetical protein [Pyrinomonadaceae bacterium]